MSEQKSKERGREASPEVGPAPRAELPEHLTEMWRRHDFLWLFDVSMGNPNGDPDNDGAPRLDPVDRHGIVTGVRLRRAIRNWVALVSRYEPEERRNRLKIYIEHGAVLNEKIRDAYVTLNLPTGQRAQREIRREDVRGEIGDLASAGLLPESFTYEVDLSGESATLAYAGELSGRELKLALDELGDALSPRTRSFIESLAREAGSPEKTRDNAEAARQQMDLNYWDVRTFGAVMSTGLDADRETGPVQIPDCRSVDPVTSLDLAITRGAVTREEDRENRSTMGHRYILPYALYRAPGFFSPTYAERTGISSEDLALFWNSLRDPWSTERSYSRGTMTTVSGARGGGLHVFSHDHPLGNAPAHELFDRVRVSLKDGVEDAAGIEDYEISTDLEGLPQGVTYTKLF